MVHCSACKSGPAFALSIAQPSWDFPTVFGPDTNPGPIPSTLLKRLLVLPTASASFKSLEDQKTCLLYDLNKAIGPTAQDRLHDVRWVLGYMAYKAKRAEAYWVRGAGVISSVPSGDLKALHVCEMADLYLKDVVLSVDAQGIPGFGESLVLPEMMLDTRHLDIRAYQAFVQACERMGIDPEFAVLKTS